MHVRLILLSQLIRESQHLIHILVERNNSVLQEFLNIFEINPLIGIGLNDIEAYLV